jgi:dipeptidyl aminopeptidase/acylaminoacyl peptidase
MSSRHTRNVALAAVSFSFCLCGSQAVAAPGRLSPTQIAQLIASAPKGTPWNDVQLSPDGTRVAYSVKRGNVAANELRTQWWLQKITHSGSAVGQPFALKDGVTAVQWCPDSKCLSLLSPIGANLKQSFAIFDVRSHKISKLIARTGAKSGDGSSVIQVSNVSGWAATYAWSPDGNFIAFEAANPPSQPNRGNLDPRRGVPYDEWNRRLSTTDAPVSTTNGLFLFDVRKLSVSRLTPPFLNVVNDGRFSWAPDSQSLAVTVDNQLNSQGTDTDLVIVKSNGAWRRLVTRPGRDGSPLWSPDGNTIAFITDNGVPNYMGDGWTATISANGGPITIYSSGTSTPIARKIVKWSPNSKSFLFTFYDSMATRLARVDVASRSISLLPLPSSVMALPFDDPRSFSADGRTMAFGRSYVALPPEVYVSKIAPNGEPIGNPRRITAVGNDFPLAGLVRSQIVAWPSTDKKFLIHGLLLTPTPIAEQEQRRAPLPTILYLVGGPDMVRTDFGIYGYEADPLALASHGYAVLVPNTRGRGGYGRSFLHGIRDSQSYLTVPYQDAISGLDSLVTAGIADPNKLGIAGQSYGGNLTEFAIDRTDRFKAAMIKEAVEINRLDLLDPVPLQSWRALIMNDMLGAGNPFSPAEKARLVDDSVGLHAERIHTPTLLEFGAMGHTCTVGRPLFAWLRAYHVPSALLIYDDGHGIESPSAFADSLVRDMEWMDHWILGVQYPTAQEALQLGPNGPIPIPCDN